MRAPSFIVSVLLVADTDLDFSDLILNYDEPSHGPRSRARSWLISHLINSMAVV
jgi:hypothetical protein